MYNFYTVEICNNLNIVKTFYIYCSLFLTKLFVSLIQCAFSDYTVKLNICLNIF